MFRGVRLFNISPCVGEREKLNITKYLKSIRWNLGCEVEFRGLPIIVAIIAIYNCAA